MGTWIIEKFLAALDPEKVAEEYIEIEKEIEAKNRKEELRQELIKTHDKKMKLRKVKILITLRGMMISISKNIMNKLMIGMSM